MQDKRSVHDTIDECERKTFFYPGSTDFIEYGNSFLVAFICLGKANSRLKICVLTSSPQTHKLVSNSCNIESLKLGAKNSYNSKILENLKFCMWEQHGKNYYRVTLIRCIFPLLVRWKDCISRVSYQKSWFSLSKFMANCFSQGLTGGFTASILTPILYNTQGVSHFSNKSLEVKIDT